jgi:hypothetical protein
MASESLSTSNPGRTHIDVPTWKAIQGLTGKTLSHADAHAKWKTAPKELHESFKAINDEFVSKLAKTTKETDEAHVRPRRPREPARP